MSYMCIKLWNEHVLQDKRPQMPNISYERAHTNHRITSEWELMSSLNSSLAWLAAIKQSRIENTLAHDLPFRENDSLVFIWLALNRQMTVAMMVRESEPEIYERTKGSLALLVLSEGLMEWKASTEGCRFQCVLRGTVVSCTPLTCVLTRTCPLLTLLGLISILVKSEPSSVTAGPSRGDELINMDRLMSPGFLCWPTCRPRRITGDLSRRPKINIPWSDGKCMTVHIKTGQKYRANVFNEGLTRPIYTALTDGNRLSCYVGSVCYVCRCLLVLVGSHFRRLNVMSWYLSCHGMLTYCNAVIVLTGCSLSVQCELVFRRKCSIQNLCQDLHI